MLEIFAVMTTKKRTRPTPLAAAKLFGLWRRSTHPTLRAPLSCRFFISPLGDIKTPLLGGDFSP
jgi:hypothetical protein